ncbi:2Fe-2S iron-sulfur cluster-binding protein [Thalassotalea maritima]|uniref:2Fe-2S iron-sulfur cluster-binding protein n=1 Tax=Thalassotalea maritima TaxID=3242416 RepID=UPI003529AB26
MSSGIYQSLEVIGVRHESADACSFTFAVPESMQQDFQYQAGQFLTLKVPHHEGELLRCYSMCSSPVVDKQLQIAVKRVVDGRASNWLCDNLAVGSQLEVMRPAGVFTVKDWSKDLLLFAGGSGITPVFSILKTALVQGSGKVRLVYANRDVDSIIFNHELNALRQRHPERLEVIHLLDALQGVPSVGLLQALCFDYQQAAAYVCGPGPYMDAVETALHNAGVNKDDIHIERFISLSSAPKAVEPSISTNENESDIIVDIDLYGNQHTISCTDGETVLNAARRQGIELPFSCEVGMCASCMCEIKEGNVDLLENEVLSERDLEQKLTLSCQAVPTSKQVKLRFT